MCGECINEWSADTSYKMRCMRSLETQIKKDSAELTQLWQKVDNI